MVNKFKYPLIALIMCISMAKVSAGAVHHKADEEVVTNLVAHSSDGIFSSNASYTFGVKNTYHTSQEGTVSYIVTTPAGKQVASNTVNVKISGNSNSSYNFTIPAM